MLNRESMVKKLDKGLEVVEIEIKSLGDTARIKKLGSNTMLKLTQAMMSVDKNGKVTQNLDGMYSKFIIATLVDENDKPIFTNADVNMINEWDSVTITELYMAVSKVNGLGVKEEEQIKN